jgi:hypothetical protein
MVVLENATVVELIKICSETAAYVTALNVLICSETAPYVTALNVLICSETSPYVTVLNVLKAKHILKRFFSTAT